MEITVKTNKKYDYRLTITSIDGSAENLLSAAKGMNFQFHGRYVRKDGSQVYNGTLKFFKNKAAAIRFYLSKMNEVKA